MKQKADLKSQIYDLEAQYSRKLQLMESDTRVSIENKTIIRKYAQDKLAVGVTKTRAIIIVDHLRRLACLIKKPFSQLKEQDVKDLMAAIEIKGYAESSKNTGKFILKNLLRTYKVPEEVLQWAKSKKAPNKLHPEDLLNL